MFKIKIADFVVEIDNKYDYIKKKCVNYYTEEEKVDFHVSCSDEEIEKERKNGEQQYSCGYAESVCIYRHICDELPKEGGFLLHSAILDVDGKAYAFLARSGVGKSTHVRLWKQYLGDKVKIVNGDKPIIRYKENKLIAYGTPWSGKENWDTNMKSELKSLCFLERAKENSIEKASEDEALKRLLNQVYIPEDRRHMLEILDLIGKLIKSCNLYLLKCNISINAAEVAYKELTKEN